MKKLNFSNCFVALLTNILFISCSKTTTTPSTYDPGPVSPTPASIVFPVTYGGLPWEASSTGLKGIWPPFPLSFYVDSIWLANRVKIELKQETIIVSDSLPYVYYDQMAQDTTPIFYTINPIYDDLGDKYGPLLIFGRPDANNDFSRKADVTINYIK